MNNRTLNRYLKRTNCYLGSFPRDMLPKIERKPCCLIFNDDVSQNEGSHWMAMYFDQKQTYFFDSYGRMPLTPDVENYLHINSLGPIAYSPIQLQSINTDVCGYYCVFWLICMKNDIEYCNFLNMFSKDFIYNDQMIKTLVKSLPF